jgi:hypothetical protein
MCGRSKHRLHHCRPPIYAVPVHSKRAKSSAAGLCGRVLAPTVGIPFGALAGEYVGASGDIAVGLGVGTNVLVGGSGRTIALQPVSLEGSVALDVALGVSSLQLRPMP